MSPTEILDRKELGPVTWQALNVGTCDDGMSRGIYEIAQLLIHKKANLDAGVLESLLGARTLLGARGPTTSIKKLPGASGIATRSKEATRGSWPYCWEQEATRGSRHRC